MTIQPKLVANTTEQESSAEIIPLSHFLNDFGDDLLEKVKAQNPPLYGGQTPAYRDVILDGLSRQPFQRQREAIHALCTLLLDQNEKAGILNGEMGTGKTMMAIAFSAIAQKAENFQRTLVISPPHLVYKWRREILETVPNAQVWVLNGPESLARLIYLREMISLHQNSDIPEYFVIGRTRMRMGFHWKLAYTLRSRYQVKDKGTNMARVEKQQFVACPGCATWVRDPEGEGYTKARFELECTTRRTCTNCKEPLWTLIHPQHHQEKNADDLIRKKLCQLPTIGTKTADKLIDTFSGKHLESLLADNVYEFINLMDQDGDLVFSDRQASRLEKALASIEFEFGTGHYQATEFIKRYLPPKFFDLLVVDEGHEYKNESSAQGQAMGVLCNQVRKVLLLTGTLMGGYATDLFYLLFRIMPQRLVEDGFGYNDRGSLGSASMAFMREFGVLIDTYTESNGDSHKTARAKRTNVRTRKGPGFSPYGILRYILPYTVFVRLNELEVGVLPEYHEHMEPITLTEEQRVQYSRLSLDLKDRMRKALALGDTSLIGVVINVLLAWPDCCFKEEVVKHPRTREVLAIIPKMFGDDEMTPKEQRLLELCLEQKAQGRRSLVYTVYTQKRDTSTRLKKILASNGLKVALLRSSVPTHQREDWIAEQVERDVDVLLCNPELVKTGLDLLDFPSIIFMQTGYNVYTLMQAARRSWRIGQTEEVNVWFLGYLDTAQTGCLELMASKINVSQSTSGEMPDSGLDVLNSGGDSIEVALAKQLIAA